MKKIIDLYKKYEELVNYVIVGGLTTVVSIGTKWGLLLTILDAKNAFELQVAVIISWICAVTFAYIMNRIAVFKSENKDILKEVISFVGARVITLLVEMGLMWFFITLLGLNSNMWVFIVTMIVQVIILVLNYIFSKIFVFKKKKV